MAALIVVIFPGNDMSICAIVCPETTSREEICPKRSDLSRQLYFTPCTLFCDTQLVKFDEQDVQKAAIVAIASGNLSKVSDLAAGRMNAISFLVATSTASVTFRSIRRLVHCPYDKPLLLMCELKSIVELHILDFKVLASQLVTLSQVARQHFGR